MRKTALVFFSFLLFLTVISTKNAFAQDIKINELLPNPNEGDKEFVEFYSTGTIDLKNYYLKDKADTKKIIDNFQNCGNYYVWELSTSTGEGYLNNTGEESIFLYDPSDNLIDSYENWSSPEEGLSLGRVPDAGGSFVKNEFTKCAANQEKIDPSPSPSSTPATSPSPTPTTKSSPTPKVSAKASPKSSPTPSSAAKTASANTQVLGQSDQSSDSGRVVSTTQMFSSPPQSDQGYSQPVSQKVAAILIGAGAILVGFSFMSFMWYKRSLGRANINKEKDRFEENKQEE